MAALTVQTIDINGLADAYVAADVAGDTYPNTGREFVEIINAGVAPIVATFVQVTNTLNTGENIEPTALTIPNTGNPIKLGAYSTQLYGDPVAITYSDVASVTVQVWKLITATRSVVAG